MKKLANISFFDSIVNSSDTIQNANPFGKLYDFASSNLLKVGKFFDRSNEEQERIAYYGKQFYDELNNDLEYINRVLNYVKSSPSHKDVKQCLEIYREYKDRSAKHKAIQDSFRRSILPDNGSFNYYEIDYSGKDENNEVDPRTRNRILSTKKEFNNWGNILGLKIMELDNKLKEINKLTAKLRRSR